MPAGAAVAAKLTWRGLQCSSSSARLPTGRGYLPPSDEPDDATHNSGDQAAVHGNDHPDAEEDAEAVAGNDEAPGKLGWEDCKHECDLQQLDKHIHCVLAIVFGDSASPRPQ